LSFVFFFAGLLSIVSSSRKAAFFVTFFIFVAFFVTFFTFVAFGAGLASLLPTWGKVSSARPFFSAAPEIRFLKLKCKKYQLCK
jgi:hypothetical protein